MFQFLRNHVASLGAVLFLIAASGATAQEVIDDVHIVGIAVEDASEQLTTNALSIETGSHMIQVGDELEIRYPYRPLPVDQVEVVPQSPPPRSELVVVRDDGRISLPLVGTVQAANRSPEAVQSELIARYEALARSAEANNDREYRIAVHDKVEIRFRYQDELNQTVRVLPDGRVNLFHLGSIRIGDRTPEEVDAMLTEGYAGVVGDPEISIAVTPANHERAYSKSGLDRIPLQDFDGLTVIVRGYERKVYVTGEVEIPRVVTFRGSLSVVQAIASAGGAKRSARLSRIVILRGGDDPAQARCLCCDLHRTLRGKGCSDCALEHEDVVIVPKTPIARLKDTLDQYVYDILPWTRNSPNFTFFTNLSSGGAIPAAAIAP